MRTALIISLVLTLVLFAGCALLNKAAPSQLDEMGQPIPGTHTANPVVENVAASIPYGSVGLNALLLLTNFIEIYREKKIKKGLMATIRAIEQASKDPKIQDAIAKLKELLANAHSAADVQPLINDLIAKIKST